MFILEILKIFGIILISVLLFLCLILALFLFVPVKYSIKFNYADRKLNYKIDLSFLVNVFKIKLKENEKIKFYFLFFKIYEFSSKAKSNRKSTKKDKVKNSKHKVNNNNFPDKNVNVNVYENENIKTDNKIIKTDNKIINSDADSNNLVFTESKAPKESDRDNKIQKLQQILQNIKFYINYIQDKKQKKLRSFILDNLKALLKCLEPDKGSGSLIFGFETPDITGMVMGFTSLFIWLYPYSITISPDFEKQTFKAHMDYKGKVYIYKLLLIAFRTYFNKDIQKLITVVKYRDSLTAGRT